MHFSWQESKVRFDSDSEFKERARANVVKLQRGDPEIRKAWELICEASRKGMYLNNKYIKVILGSESFIS